MLEVVYVGYHKISVERSYRYAWLPMILFCFLPWLLCFYFILMDPNSFVHYFISLAAGTVASPSNLAILANLCSDT